MKKHILLAACLSLIFSQFTKAQNLPPDLFHYQAVVRDADGNILVNQPVEFQFSIIHASVDCENGSGQVINMNIKTATTNAFGLVFFNLGEYPLDDLFTGLDWGSQCYWLRVEAKRPGQTDFSYMGKSRLVSVPYAMYSRKAETASAATTAVYADSAGVAGNSDWVNVGDTILYTLNKNIGIGTSDPDAPLHIASGGVIITSSFAKNELIFSKDPQGNSDPVEVVSQGTAPIQFITNGFETMRINPGSLQISASSGNNEIIFHTFQGNDDPAEIVQQGNAPLKFSTNNMTRMVISADGWIGIGTENPQAELQVEGRITAGSRIYPGYTGTEDGYSLVHFKNGTAAHGGIIRASQGDGDGGDAPMLYQASSHHFNSDVEVCKLIITGGCDITEKFSTIESSPLQPGEVVLLDPAHENHILRSHKAYDRTAFGVVSGAGGVKPGLELKQEGMLDGNIPVAIAGRVKVKVTGKVEPGDLLTTSDVPGHAMAAKSRRKRDGAVIGKALSKPDAEGLVLMLVMAR